MLAMLVADPTDAAALGKLDHVLIGGEAFTPALAGEALALLNGRLTNMYGPTETTVWSLVHEVERYDVIPIGRPIANTTVHVVDATGAPTPVGVPGELLIGGAGVTRGYHDRAELTAARFIEHPQWGRVYATGDRATIQPDGVVEFGGRLDNQVKVRGYRIELGEIESALEDDAQIARAVVVAVSVDNITELVAFVTPKDASSFDLARVQRGLSARLPEPMVPRGFDVRDSLPTMPNGKTDRVALAKVASAVLTAPASASVDRILVAGSGAVSGRRLRNARCGSVGGRRGHGDRGLVGSPRADDPTRRQLLRSRWALAARGQGVPIPD